MSVLHVFGSVALPQVAGLVPVIDGEPAERVFVAGGLNEPSTTMVVTKSGKEAPLSQLSAEDQVKVARAFDAMRISAP